MWCSRNEEKRQVYICEVWSVSECVRKWHGLTVFKDESNSIDKFPAEEHDGIVPAGAWECLSLSVGVQHEASALIQELLIGRADVCASDEQFLKKCGSVKGKKRNKNMSDLGFNLNW